MLASLAVLATAAAVTLVAVRSGPGGAGCPAEQSWVQAQPVGVSFAVYGVGIEVTGGARGGPADTVAGAVVSPRSPVLAGCVDTDRLHPMPAPVDGRG